MSDGGWTGSSTPYLGDSQGDVWRDEAAAQGHTGSQRIIWAGETKAPGDVTSALALAPGSPVISRRRLILLDDRPVELANSYWPTELAGNTALAQPKKIKGGAVTLLAHLGYRPASVDEAVHTRPPTDEERLILQLAESEWVLILTRTITDAAGTPYEAAVNVSPGRVGRLNYSMKVD
jgi:DNA-binding GntR family transcriptional regulator